MQRLKGFREIYPEEAEKRREVFDTIEEIGRSYGFKKVETPSLEPLELYKRKSGEEIVGETYSFRDKAGREVTLTPELTPSLARMFSNKEQELSKPVKWFCGQKLWRYEQPQSGRLREFYQPNFDIFGSKKGEEELISLAYDILTELGLSDDDFVFKIGHRSLAKGLKKELNIKDGKKIYRAIDKKEKVEEKEFRDLLKESGLDKNDIDLVTSFVETEDINKISEVIENDFIKKGEKDIVSLFNNLESYGVQNSCEFDPSIVRGLDYYTGIVFECFDADEELRSIFGGGRYDDLIESLGGPKTPAVGLGIGDATLELLLKKNNNWPKETGIDYYIAIIGDVRSTAINIARSLRYKGYTTDIELSEKSFSEQLRRADKLNADKTIIVGEKDLSENVITIKNMKTGEQEKTPLEDFTENIE